MATATEPITSFVFKPAARKAVPMLISLSGTSGSGKTFSGLLLAAGLAGTGRVAMIDAENGRGALYEDDPDIRAALPNGYDYTQIAAPYSPERYTAAITAAEKNGAAVCIIDSTSHEWEGEGGCCDIAENNKLRGMPNWAKAKLAHKRFVGHCLSSPMHIIFCLRAREKVKIAKDANGKEQVMPLGIQPIAEKNFVFEQLLSLQFDEATHRASGIKVPKMLSGMFSGHRLITKTDGEAIRKWNETGVSVETDEILKKRSAACALGGTAEYAAFFETLTAPQRKMLVASVHGQNKKLAEQADAEAKAAESQEDPAAGDVPDEQRKSQSDKISKLPDLEDFPDPMNHEMGKLVKVKGALFVSNLDRSGWQPYKEN